MPKPTDLEVFIYKYTLVVILFEFRESAQGSAMSAKRAIETETDVFAMIWSCRKAGEETENEILRRVLREYLAMFRLPQAPVGNDSVQPKKLRDSQQRESPLEILEVKSSRSSLAASNPDKEEDMAIIGKIRWVDDVQAALRALGGRGALLSIYREVEKRRKHGNRSVPKTLEATVRRTLEDHSSDSANFRGDDLFANIGRGEWALRS